MFWHERLIGMATVSQIQPSWILVSEHGDGEMLALALKQLGYRPRRGSSTRGGTKALLQMLRGDDGDMGVAITPDGPRGPAQELGKGVIFLASRAGLPIYPMTTSFSACWKLPTWDRLILPAPFSQAITVLGEPIHVPAKLRREELEMHRQQIEQALRSLTEDTDRNFDQLFPTARRRSELDWY